MTGDEDGEFEALAFSPSYAALSLSSLRVGQETHSGQDGRDPRGDFTFVVPSSSREGGDYKIL